MAEGKLETRDDHIPMPMLCTPDSIPPIFRIFNPPSLNFINDLLVLPTDLAPRTTAKATDTAPNQLTSCLAWAETSSLLPRGHGGEVVGVNGLQAPTYTVSEVLGYRLRCRRRREQPLGMHTASVLILSFLFTLSCNLIPTELIQAGGNHQDVKLAGFNIPIPYFHRVT
ncbi:hypothetical protein BDR04DRAFT_1150441 [Suillus decipiens]|nr:hypothetical protein BDR04DRAFT_1150441 [Suillus decipiens]